MESLGFHAVKPKSFYNADSSNLSCIQTLYIHSFDASNQLTIELCDIKRMMTYNIDFKYHSIMVYYNIVFITILYTLLNH